MLDLAACLLSLLTPAAEVTNSVGMTLTRLDAGEFVMGQGTAGPRSRIEWLQRDADEAPAHTVRISKPFYLGVHEVTNAQFERFDPGHKKLRGTHGATKEDDDPVTFVTWRQAVEFCAWLAKKEGKPYRLPTEAEWEYACRAGTTTPFSTGDTLPATHANLGGPLLAAAAKVGSFKPNVWGLYDMHGNVAEWCHDWHGPYEANTQTDPVGAADGIARVVRGWSYLRPRQDAARFARSANRSGLLPEDANRYTGFRVVQGEMPATKPLPVAELPPHQQNVKQTPAPKDGPDASKPYFVDFGKNNPTLPPNTWGPIFSNHNHYSAACVCPNGDVLAVWYTCVGERDRQLAQAATRLRVGSEKWEPASLFFAVPDVNCHAPVLLRDGNRIYHFCTQSLHGWDYASNMMRYSDDSGATWSKPTIILPRTDPDHLSQPCSAFVAADGTLVLACDGDRHKDEKLMLSRDKGKTWTVAKGDMIKPVGRTAIHPAVVERKDHAILSFLRGPDPMPMLVSKDRGDSWEVTTTPFAGITGGQKAAVLRLASGAILMLTIDRDNRLGGGALVALSLDEGKTWPHARKVDAPVGGYMSVAQAPNGLIYLIGSRLTFAACNEAWVREGGPMPAKKETDVKLDTAGYKPAAGVSVRQDGTRVHVRWPAGGDDHGELVLQLQPDQPLIEEMGLAKDATGPSTPLLRKVNPATHLTVGVRDLSAQGWNVFFDNPIRRPNQTFPAKLARTSARVESSGRRTSISVGGLSAGPFAGELRFTVYAGCALVHTEAVVSTEKDACAILYDAGLTSAAPSWTTTAWLDNRDRWQRAPATTPRPDAVAARHRAIVAEGDGGSVAVFPPPHQYLYPLDFADNFRFVWHGRGYRGSGEFGLGVRQPPEGDGRYVPWINAPPGTKQRLGVFYLLSREQAQGALDQARRFTRCDTFKKLPGHVTFTSHYHVEHTLDYVRRQKEQKTDGVPKGLEVPGFVKTFKGHGVDIVHLAEFHVRHTPEMDDQRLALLKTLHDECRRLSGDGFLLLPGEEPNVHLGGHWISLFPKPVYWHLHPKAGTPFERKVDGAGTVYAVQSADDVLRLMEKERGLMWTAHARTKSSHGFPDRYRERDFYRSDRFLGAAWKAMPADLSQPRLGRRVLDLMDDMATWGGRKYVLGEVDVFRVEPGYELYGHMNINYLKLDKVPRFDDGWQPVVDALRGGRFFVSTGEVLIPSCTVGGTESGQTLRLGGKTTVDLEARLEWTFPPAFAEVVWGDGKKVHRKRVELSDEPAFGDRRLRVAVDLAGANWVRLEAWDVAANGAFTQPVWVE